jgi:hypothetical protein
VVCRGRSLRMACVPVGRSRSFGCVGSGLSISGRGVAFAWWVGRLVVRWAGCPIGWCRGWRGRTGDEVGLDDRRRIVGRRGGGGLDFERAVVLRGRSGGVVRSVGRLVSRTLGRRVGSWREACREAGCRAVGSLVGRRVGGSVLDLGSAGGVSGVRRGGRAGGRERAVSGGGRAPHADKAAEEGQRPKASQRAKRARGPCSMA